MGKVMAVNISVKRGTQKVNVHTVKLIENYGLENAPTQKLAPSVCFCLMKNRRI